MSGVNAEIIDYLKLEKQVRLDGLEMMDKSTEIPQRLLKEVSIFSRWIEHLANETKTSTESERVCPFCKSKLINFNYVEGWSCDNCDETW